MALRGFLCWVLAEAVTRDSALLFPAALGVLVASKALRGDAGGGRPAPAPAPPDAGEVQRRVSLAGVTGAAVSAPLAAGAAFVGAEWALRYAFVLFVVATVWRSCCPRRSTTPRGRGGCR